MKNYAVLLRMVSVGLLSLLFLGTVSCAKESPSVPDAEPNTDLTGHLESSGGKETGGVDGEAGKKEDEESESRKEEEEEEDLPERSIDLYLIAGQSNAAGCTKVTDRAAAYALAPELETGFSNVHYAGNSRSNGSGTRDRDLDWQPVTLGLGVNNRNYMGPEAGMAMALATYYNEESGKDAGIIKYAYGGSSLLNRTDGSTHKDGNWASPSYVATLPASEVNSATGKMYRNFLDQVEKNISELRKYGKYTTVNLCGLYWMQGCANRSNPTEYETAFTYFAADIRADLSALLKEYTGTEDDCGASEMPIIVGTISRTQNLTGSDVENINKAFIAMQKGLAEKIEHCYVVDHSDYAITAWENGQQVVLGSDQWHWKQADMLEIGENVGKAMLDGAGRASDAPVPDTTVT